MNERRILEIERRLVQQEYELDALRRKLTEVAQLVPKAFAGSPAPAPTGGGNAIRRARATKAISGGTFISPSTDGEVQLYNAAGTPTGDPVPVRNQHGGDQIPFAVGSALFVAQINDAWFAITGDCPPVDKWEEDEPIDPEDPEEPE